MYTILKNPQILFLQDAKAHAANDLANNFSLALFTKSSYEF